MLANTKGIVLHFVKYGENSVIVTIYTEKFGRQSYIINSARSKKAKNKANFLQPLFVVDLVSYQKETREVQRIKEIKIALPYQSIPYEIKKSTQAIFIAEILYRTLQEEESYPKLYNFLENSFQYFDLLDNGINNFHIYFLVRLTKYLGIYPNNEFIELHPWFDLKKGLFTPTEPTHNLFMNIEITNFLKRFITIEINELDQVKLTRQNRDILLEKIIFYYQSHFETLTGLKSLPVLKEIFK